MNQNISLDEAGNMVKAALENDDYSQASAIIISIMMQILEKKRWPVDEIAEFKKLIVTLLTISHAAGVDSASTINEIETEKGMEH
jgi:hypothetical protein